MSRTVKLRRTVAVLAALVAPLVVVPLVLGSPTADASDTSSTATAARARVTFVVDSCEGCRLRLTQADRRYTDVWQSTSKRVADGNVSWSVPRKRATGLSVTVLAPWEGATGYVTQVVFRYAGERTGGAVSVAQARTKQRGTLCLEAPAGTSSIEVPLRVRRVKVPGRGGRVDGTLAFASTTQRLIRPVTPVFDGVGGSQDVPYCVF